MAAGDAARGRALVTVAAVAGLGAIGIGLGGGDAAAQAGVALGGVAVGALGATVAWLGARRREVAPAVGRAALAEREAELRLYAEALPDHGAALLDAAGRVRAWSAGAAALTGYVGAEVRHRPWTVFFDGADLAADVPARLLADADAAGRACRELTWVRRDGTRFACRVRVTPTAGAARWALLVTDCTAERRAQAMRSETEALVDRARRTSQAQYTRGRMLSHLAHELRTPASNLVGFAELLLGGAGGPLAPAGEAGLRRIHDSARHLHALVDDILDLTKVESGQMTFRRERVDLAAGIAAALELVAPAAAARGVCLEVAGAVQPATVVTDGGRLRQVLVNFLANAVRASPEGGCVRVRAREEGEHFRVEVADEGPGVPPDVLAHLFQEFPNRSGRPDPHGEGTGLGLALCRRLAEAQGGRVGAHAGPTGGAVFFVSLPARGDDAERPIRVFKSRPPSRSFPSSDA